MIKRPRKIPKRLLILNQVLILIMTMGKLQKVMMSEPRKMTKRLLMIPNQVVILLMTKGKL